MGNHIILYNNYETEDGNVVFLPLFDCMACKRFNDVILRYYYHDSSYTNQLYFYEDDSIAAKIERLGGVSALDGGYPQLAFDSDDTQASFKDIEISKQEQSINTLNEAILADPEAAAKVLMSYIKE